MNQFKIKKKNNKHKLGHHNKELVIRLAKLLKNHQACIILFSTKKITRWSSF